MCIQLFSIVFDDYLLHLPLPCFFLFFLLFLLSVFHSQKYKIISLIVIALLHFPCDYICSNRIVHATCNRSGVRWGSLQRGQVSPILPFPTLHIAIVVVNCLSALRCPPPVWGLPYPALAQLQAASLKVSAVTISS